MHIVAGILLISILLLMMYFASSAHFAKRRHKKTKNTPPAAGQLWIEDGSIELEIIRVDSRGMVTYYRDEDFLPTLETMDVWKIRVDQRMRYLLPIWET